MGGGAVQCHTGGAVPSDRPLLKRLRQDGPSKLLLSVRSHNDAKTVFRGPGPKSCAGASERSEFAVWAPDKVCSWCIVPGHDLRCTLSPKPIDQKFFKLSTSARATDLALKNILQPIFLIDCAHFVLSLWYGPQTRFVHGV